MRRHLVALLAGVALAAISAPALAQVPATTPDTQALQSHITDLEAEMETIAAESQELGGSRSITDSQRNLRGERYNLDAQAERLDQMIEDIGGRKSELEAEKTALEGQWIAGGGDIAQEGGEKVAEMALKQVLSKGASKTLGAGGWIVDAVDYGGRKILKEIHIGNLEEAIKSQRLALSDAYKLRIALSGAINENIRKQRRLGELRQRWTQAMDDLSASRARLRLRTDRATRGAVLGRDEDPADDEAVRKSLNRVRVTSVSFLQTRPDLQVFGFGTRITGGDEIRIVGSEVEEMTGLRIAFSFPAGNGALDFSLSRTEGAGDDRFAAAAGGADDFGFTFLEPQPLSGGGTSTGLFVGNGWNVDAASRTEATNWRAEITYDLGLDGPFLSGLSVGMTLDRWDQEGLAAGTFENGGSTIDTEARMDIREWVAGMSALYGADIQITPELEAWFYGKAGAAVRNTEARLEQTTTCAFCGPDLQSVVQRVEVDESDIIPVWAFGFGARYQIVEGGQVELGVEVSNGPSAGFRIPANPDQQPARFDDNPSPMLTLQLGARFRF